MKPGVTTAHGITYRNESKPFKYRYVLLEDAYLFVPGVDFGHWRANGAHDGKTYIVADGPAFFVKAGYAWDGCTHAIDRDWNMRASLFHDAMYQAKKCGIPSTSWWNIDNIFRNVMKQDGASLLERNTYYYGVRVLGAPYKLEKFDSLVEAPLS